MEVNLTRNVSPIRRGCGPSGEGQGGREGSRGSDGLRIGIRG